MTITPTRYERREFIWYTPAGASRTEYEDLTVHQQSSPLHYAVQGWAISFPDGSPPQSPGSTAVRSGDWYDFRDPEKVLDRTWVSTTSEISQSFRRLVDSGTAGGQLANSSKSWLHDGLARHLAVYPFVDYSHFVALAYAERQALSDTTTIPAVFEAADKLRHVQDAVYLSLRLDELGLAPRPPDLQRAWLTSPVWQGVRAASEQLLASQDWVENLVAINLVFDQLVGRLFRVEYLSRFASAFGDMVTPLLVSTWLPDVARSWSWTTALVRFLADDQRHGAHNREVIASWFERWFALAGTAAERLAPLFRAPGGPTDFEQAWSGVRRRHQELLWTAGIADVAGVVVQ